MMEEKLRRYVDGLFKDVQLTKSIVELKEEMIQNLSEKFQDLLQEGKTEEMAFNIAVSGIGDISSLMFDSIKTDTVSGRVNIYNVTSDSLSFNTTSGDVNISDTISTEVSHSSVSGVFDFDGELKKLNANSTSGRVALTSRIAPEAIDIDTISGRINVSVPKSDEINVSYNTISGKFTCDFPVLMNKSDSNYSFTTGSGNIAIEELK